ncbi:zinc finger protein OZF-like [Thalassophryne amazonica]|uniref:zinc finger protein OZF-like n=1 Tax=Thalassophryne amazonica TaxID=390379 RepID=UPI0014713437|nr:zinc finger protein OZF-like [Thalassophryne amazonica]
MSQVQQLREMLKQRLTAADDELLELFERTITEYEEQICRLKEENKRNKVLDAVFNPQVDVHRADIQQLLVSKEEIVPQEQDWYLSVDLDDIKHEQEKLGTTREGQLLQQLEEADTTPFLFSPITVKSEHVEEKPQIQINQCQTDETMEAESPASNSPEHRTAQHGGEDYRRTQPPSNWGPYSHLHPDTGGRSLNSSESETDSYEWKQTGQLPSSCVTNTDVCVSNSSYTNAQTQCNWSKYGKIFCHMDYSKQHINQASAKPFSCPEQGRRWRENGILSTHMKSHAAEKPFGCSECGKRFKIKNTLSEHMRIHTGDKPFGCFECGKRFRSKSTLTRHMRVHTDVKPFGCSECGKRFKYKASHSKHMSTHTGNKPFGCSQCGKRFGQKSYMHRHMRIHTSDKPYSCSQCGKRFGQRSSLKDHMIFHTGEKRFACSVCRKLFGLKSNLNKHMRIHTGERPYGCFQCGKRFGQKGHLNKHLRIHSREKPFGS